MAELGGHRRWLAALKGGERPRIQRAKLPGPLDRFIDAREESSTLWVDEPFQVATLVKKRKPGRAHHTGAVMFLHPLGSGGIFDDEGQSPFKFKNVDLVKLRSADVFVRLVCLFVCLFLCFFVCGRMHAC